MDTSKKPVSIMFSLIMLLGAAVLQFRSLLSFPYGTIRMLLLIAVIVLLFIPGKVKDSKKIIGILTLVSGALLLYSFMRSVIFGRSNFIYCIPNALLLCQVILAGLKILLDPKFSMKTYRIISGIMVCIYLWLILVLACLNYGSVSLGQVLQYIGYWLLAVDLCMPQGKTLLRTLTKRSDCYFTLKGIITTVIILAIVLGIMFMFRMCMSSSGGGSTSVCTICGKAASHVFQGSGYCDEHYRDAVLWTTNNLWNN